MDDLHVLNAAPEGAEVFVLLSDNRILRSPPLDDGKCAEQFVEQILRLKLTPVFLQNVCNFEPAEGL